MFSLQLGNFSQGDKDITPLMELYFAIFHTAHCICYTSCKRTSVCSPSSVICLFLSTELSQRLYVSTPQKHTLSQSWPDAVWQARALNTGASPPQTGGHADRPFLPSAASWGLCSYFHRPWLPPAPTAFFPNSCFFSICHLCLDNTSQSKDLLLPKNKEICSYLSLLVEELFPSVRCSLSEVRSYCQVLFLLSGHISVLAWSASPWSPDSSESRC